MGRYAVYRRKHYIIVVIFNRGQFCPIPSPHPLEDKLQCLETSLIDTTGDEMSLELNGQGPERLQNVLQDMEQIPMRKNSLTESIIGAKVEEIPVL